MTALVKSTRSFRREAVGSPLLDAPKTRKALRDADADAVDGRPVVAEHAVLQGVVRAEADDAQRVAAGLQAAAASACVGVDRGVHRVERHRQVERLLPRTQQGIGEGRAEHRGRAAIADGAKEFGRVGLAVAAVGAQPQPGAAQEDLDRALSEILRAAAGMVGGDRGALAERGHAVQLEHAQHLFGAGKAERAVVGAEQAR